MKFTKRELQELTKAWFVISLAFSILFIGGIYALNSSSGVSANSLGYSFLIYFVVSALTVGIAFLFHELMHKAIAQKYGFRAEFEAFDRMLLFALGMSFLGFIIAAPGAVMISSSSSRGRIISEEENGKISFAGPVTNLVLALIFLAFLLVPLGLSQGSFLGLFLSVGFTINALLAFFNLLPIPGFDGRKIMAWNPVVYGIAMVLSVVLFIMSFTYI